MYNKQNSNVQPYKPTKLRFGRKGRALKMKMVVSKAFLTLPAKKSLEVSVARLSRNTNLKSSIELNSSLKVKENMLSDTLGSPRCETRQSKEASVHTQETGPYLFNDEGNKEGPLKNAPTDRKGKQTCEVKQNVLRTISRMLQENRIIREQWIRPSQVGD